MSADELQKQMMAQMAEQIEVTKEEAKAQLLAAQASEEAALESKRSADASESLIRAVRKLVDKSVELIDGMTAMELVADQMAHLIQINSMIVTIVAKGDDSRAAKELEKRMHELAMAAASKGVEIRTGTTVQGDNNVHGDQQFGDKKNG